MRDENWWIKRTRSRRGPLAAGRRSNSSVLRPRSCPDRSNQAAASPSCHASKKAFAAAFAQTNRTGSIARSRHGALSRLAPAKAGWLNAASTKVRSTGLAPDVTFQLA